MTHIILFLYFINISAGIAGLAAMAVLHSRLRQEVTGSLLFVMSTLLASLILTLVSYYFGSILGRPEYGLSVRFSFGLTIAVLARLGILRALLFMKGIFRSGSISMTAGVIAVHTVNGFLAITGKSEILSILYFPSIFLVSLYLLCTGALLLRGSSSENDGTVKTLLRRLGILLLAFAPLSTIGYYLFRIFPAMSKFHISFDFFFFLAWSLITVSVFLKYMTRPVSLLENGSINSRFIGSTVYQPEKLK